MISIDYTYKSLSHHNYATISSSMSCNECYKSHDQ